MKVLVIGASMNTQRYSNKAVRLLQHTGHQVVALGSKNGEIEGIPIHTGTPQIEGIHTITIYLNPARQKPLHDYILSLKPKRLIFNPGTENPELKQLSQKQGIEVVENCTLVMLRSGIF